MPKGTWIREQTNERTAHRVPRLRGPTAGGTRVTWAFMVHFHVAHTARHVSWVSDRALPDDARYQSPVSAFVDSGRSASHLVRNLVWARYPAPEPLVWSFFPPGKRKLPISELQPTDQKNKRVPRSVAPLGAGWPLVSRVPLPWKSPLNLWHVAGPASVLFPFNSHSD